MYTWSQFILVPDTMSNRDLPYIKCKIYEFDRKHRVYLDFDENSISFIGADLVYSIDPSLIQTDDGGRQFVVLDLDYTTTNGIRDTLTVCFDVLETGSFEFLLGYDMLQHYDSDSLGLFLDAGEVPIYQRR